jgi:hypothetical protein
LLGLSARWDAIQTIAAGGYPNFEMDSVGAGFLLARQVGRSGALGLDAGATVLLLTEVQSVQQGKVEQSGQGTDVRLGTVLRGSLGAGPWRWQLEVEGEISPTRLRRDLRLGGDFPSLPVWSLGLGAGFLWAGP